MTRFPFPCTIPIVHVIAPLKPSFFLENQTSLSSSARCISSGSQTQPSSLVSNLVDSSGLSPQTLNSEEPQRADSALEFLSSHGFSDAQISEITAKVPSLLKSIDPEKTLLPILNFFYSKGLLEPEVAKLVTSCPDIIGWDLEKTIMCNYNRIHGFIKDEAKTICIVKRYPRIIYDDAERILFSNMEYLLDLGVPKPRIVKLVSSMPEYISSESEKLKLLVDEVKEMLLVDEVKLEVGYIARNSNFCDAIYVLATLHKETWDRRVEVYRGWGWSDKKISKIFRKYPTFMLFREDKINAAMDYFVNDVGWTTHVIARYPLVIRFSLKERIIPRCTVVKILWKHKLIKRDLKPASILMSTEEIFLQRYVFCFMVQLPNLFQIYEASKGSAK